MTDGVDALVDAVETAGGGPLVEGAVAKSDRAELRQRDNSMLARCEPRDRPVRRRLATVVGG
jgi:hypothetical protein